MDRDAFDTYVEKVLIPELEPGSVVILGNPATRKSDTASVISSRIASSATRALKIW